MKLKFILFPVKNEPNRHDYSRYSVAVLHDSLQNFFDLQPFHYYLNEVLVTTTRCTKPKLNNQKYSMTVKMYNIMQFETISDDNMTFIVGI